MIIDDNYDDDNTEKTKQNLSKIIQNHKKIIHKSYKNHKKIIQKS